MRAIRFDQFGGPEVLRLVEAEVPQPGPGEVSIDVAYVGINFADLKARSVGYRVESLPFVPGLELSGRIRAVGAGVEGLVAGQEVAAMTEGGAYADVALAPAVTVFPLPEGVSLRTAATLPTVLPTAHALIHEVGRLQPGESVLVQGAAGGVGTVAGQLAKLAGAGAVYGVVSSEAKADYARKHGYDDAFLTGAFDADVLRATGGRGVDLVLDPVGGETLRRGLESLALFGRLVSYGNASGEAAWQVGQGELYPRGRTVSGFSILGLAAGAPRALREIADRALRLATSGQVELPVTAEFALEEAAAAHELMEGRTSTGKLLLRVS
ncbi:quinone oxidoreductase family protein [Streptomyces violascens]|uniref:NADPH:quinone reductase n=1 Tax=Streptomyces violascens TaxID=67381 RepID=A0ABQ3QQY4_9ACTN|nr:zinc-binding dehydrogenase [Streptomyces violascens]GGU46190.1 NADPH:quinone reductase [Streptomyces violascens]GHI39663.1 NADPH:quinone reductase [Streptomyces violascens]